MEGSGHLVRLEAAREGGLRPGWLRSCNRRDGELPPGDPLRSASVCSCTCLQLPNHPFLALPASGAHGELECLPRGGCGERAKYRPCALHVAVARLPQDAGLRAHSEPGLLLGPRLVARCTGRALHLGRCHSPPDRDADAVIRSAVIKCMTIPPCFSSFHLTLVALLQ